MNNKLICLRNNNIFAIASISAIIIISFLMLNFLDNQTKKITKLNESSININNIIIRKTKCAIF
ncbi:hypothetical protein SAMN05421544_1133 [Riemerella columbipharyngis]|uniref:Uncharacterized protein n=1 Tax=Riemerella columbipharyngis TaxID=1071918 RepID=A0A1G7DWB0_9FLAO|nr:hypothetical protein SAMN05421544_1133 [Riemerella columbipharyngis]